MSVLPEPLLKLYLYGAAPFFGNPLKPLLNRLCGASYERSYTHFRRDHKVTKNILFHLLCLGFQLTSNYGLLAELDALLFGGKNELTGAATAEKNAARAAAAGEVVEETDDAEEGVGPLALATTVLWSATLLADSKGAPALVRFGSVACLVTAYRNRHAIHRNYQLLQLGTCALEMLGVQTFVINKARDTGGKNRVPFNAKQLLGMIAVRLLLHRFVKARYTGKKTRTAVNTLCAFMILRGTWGGVVLTIEYTGRAS